MNFRNNGSRNVLLPTTLVGSYPQPDWLIDRKRLTEMVPPRARAPELWRVEKPLLDTAQDDDTLLAAYRSAQEGYRDGIPDHVVLFTDGRNEDDPGSLSAAQLSAELRAAADPKRPVHVTVISFGPESNAQAVAKALEPVHGYVDSLTTADEVGAAFIHSAAGGVHH